MKVRSKNTQKIFKTFYFLYTEKYKDKFDLSKKVELDLTTIARIEKCFNSDINCNYNSYKILREVFDLLINKFDINELTQLIFDTNPIDFDLIIKIILYDKFSDRFFYENKAKILKIIDEYKKILNKIDSKLIEIIQNKINKGKNIKNKIKANKKKNSIEKEILAAVRKKNKKIEKNKETIIKMDFAKLKQELFEVLNKQEKPKIKINNKKIKRNKVKIILSASNNSETILKLYNYFDSKESV